MNAITAGSTIFTPAGRGLVTAVEVRPAGTTVTAATDTGSRTFPLADVSPELTEGDRIVWGVGRLPGRFVRYDSNDFAVIRLNRDLCSMTTSTDAVAPADETTVTPTYSFYSDDTVWDHEFCAPDDNCGCMD